MRAIYSTCLLLAGFCVAQQTVLAQSKPLELKWNELASMIAGHHVEILLAGSGTVRGEAVAVRQDTLVIDVTKASGPKPYASGNAEIPRKDIEMIKLQRARGSWGRTLGTVIGVVAGLGGGGYAASRTNSGGAAVGVLVAVTSATAVGGYYAGRSLDRRVTLIRIVP
jgi:hypothetical protein